MRPPHRLAQGAISSSSNAFARAAATATRRHASQGAATSSPAPSATEAMADDFHRDKVAALKKELRRLRGQKQAGDGDAAEINASMRQTRREIRGVDTAVARQRMFAGEDVNFGQLTKKQTYNPYVTIEGDLLDEGADTASLDAEELEKQLDVKARALRDVAEDGSIYSAALATVGERGMDVAGLFEAVGCPDPHSVFLHLATMHKTKALVLGDRDVAVLLNRLADEIVHRRDAVSGGGGGGGGSSVSQLEGTDSEHLTRAFAVKEICEDTDIDFFHASHSALLRVAAVCRNLEQACVAFQDIVAVATEADYGQMVALAGAEGETEFALELLEEVRAKLLRTTGAATLTDPLLVRAAVAALAAGGRAEEASALAEASLEEPHLSRHVFRERCAAGDVAGARHVLATRVAAQEGERSVRSAEHTVPLLRAMLTKGDGLEEALAYLEELALPETTAAGRGGGKRGDGRRSVTLDHLVAVVRNIVARLNGGDGGGGGGGGGGGSQALHPLAAAAASLWGLLRGLRADRVPGFASGGGPRVQEQTEELACLVADALHLALKAQQQQGGGGAAVTAEAAAEYHTALLTLHESAVDAFRDHDDELGVQPRASEAALVGSVAASAVLLPGEAALSLALGTLQRAERAHPDGLVPPETYGRVLLRMAAAPPGAVSLREAVSVYRRAPVKDALLRHALGEALQCSGERAVALRLATEVYNKLESKLLLQHPSLASAACVTMGQLAQGFRGLGTVSILSTLSLMDDEAPAAAVLSGCNRLLVPFALLSREAVTRPEDAAARHDALLGLPHVEVVRVAEQVLAHAGAEAAGLDARFDYTQLSHRMLCFAWFLQQAVQGHGVKVQLVAPERKGDGGGPTPQEELAAALEVTIKRV